MQNPLGGKDPECPSPGTCPLWPWQFSLSPSWNGQTLEPDGRKKVRLSDLVTQCCRFFFFLEKQHWSKKLHSKPQPCEFPVCKHTRAPTHWKGLCGHRAERRPGFRGTSTLQLWEPERRVTESSNLQVYLWKSTSSWYFVGLHLFPLSWYTDHLTVSELSLFRADVKCMDMETWVWDQFIT